MKFPGYDENSKTLRASPLIGECMRGIIDARYRTCWHDAAARIASGDFVRLSIRYDDDEIHIVKELRVTRDGRWWGRCADGVFEIGIFVQPFAIEKIVALSEQWWPPMRVTHVADEEQCANFALLAREAVAEWDHHGHVAGVAFPGLQFTNYFLPDGRDNPDFRRSS